MYCGSSRHAMATVTHSSLQFLTAVVLNVNAGSTPSHSMCGVYGEVSVVVVVVGRLHALDTSYKLKSCKFQVASFKLHAESKLTGLL